MRLHGAEPKGSPWMRQFPECGWCAGCCVSGGGGGNGGGSEQGDGGTDATAADTADTADTAADKIGARFAANKALSFVNAAYCVNRKQDDLSCVPQKGGVRLWVASMVRTAGGQMAWWGSAIGAAMILMAVIASCGFTTRWTHDGGDEGAFKVV